MKRLQSLERLASTAWNGTSFSPEKRGASFIQEHEAALEEDLKNLPEEHHARYISVFKALCSKYLSSHSNVVSTMIAGPSNFPAARMNKRAGWAHDHYTRISEFRDRFPKWVKKKERLEKQAEAIAEGKVFTNEIDRLTQKLADLEQERKDWKLINSAHASFLKTGAIDPELPAAWHHIIRSYKAEFGWEPHPIAPYRFRNMSGQIKQVKDRLAQLSRKEEIRLTAGVQGNRTWQGDGVKIIERMDINRVQIVHDKKPGPDVITALKKGGWRWSPREKAWQVHASSWALHKAQDITGIDIKAPAVSSELPTEGHGCPSVDYRACRVCGCTENDCRQCIEKTGTPCQWVEQDLCSACVDRNKPSFTRDSEYDTDFPEEETNSCCGPVMQAFEAPECSAVHSPQVTKIFMDTEGNVFDENKNYMGKGTILEGGRIEITRDHLSVEVKFNMLAIPKETGPGTLVHKDGKAQVVTAEEAERLKAYRKSQQQQFDDHNQTDGFGNCFSDADPGL